MTKEGYLILEDGSVYEGLSFGHDGTSNGEVVFNTSFCGYQEILTDPSYKGQIVVMTTPHVGNYGINDADSESPNVYLSGFIATNFSSVYSNFRANKSLKDFLVDNKIVAVHGIDTRAVTKKLRVSGSLNGIISTESARIESLAKELKSIPRMAGQELASLVTGSRKLETKGMKTVCLIDCGYKENIQRELSKRKFSVKVVPISDIDGINIDKFDAFCISNGPGDPVPVKKVNDLAKKITEKRKPLLGICLGHQIIANALGAKVIKLKFGHHGGNHPVIDEQTQKVYITSQNHGFSVNKESAEKSGFKVWFRNLYDNSIEGLRHSRFPLLCVQFHPEASPGPHETNFIFDEFTGMIK